MPQRGTISKTEIWCCEKEIINSKIFFFRKSTATVTEVNLCLMFTEMLIILKHQFNCINLWPPLKILYKSSVFFYYVSGVQLSNVVSVYTTK